jgi:hypothetical protein
MNRDTNYLLQRSKPLHFLVSLTDRESSRLKMKVLLCFVVVALVAAVHVGTV